MDADVVESIAIIMGRQGHHDDERMLLEAEVTDSLDPPDEGVNDTRVLTFSDGTFGIFKSFAGLSDDTAGGYGHERPLQPIHEVAAWQLAHRLGPESASLVPPTVLRSVDGELGSLSRGVGGQPQSTEAVPDATLERAGFFDALIGQQDRHSGNFLVDGDTLHLIDHGFSFATPGDFMNQSQMHSWRLHNKPDITSGERSALVGMVESGDLYGMQGVLEFDRAAALSARVQRMLDAQRVIEVADFGAGVGRIG